MRTRGSSKYPVIRKCWKSALRIIWVVILLGCTRYASTGLTTQKPLPTATVQLSLEPVKTPLQPTATEANLMTLMPEPTVTEQAVELAVAGQNLETIPSCLNNGSPDKSEASIPITGSILYTNLDQNTLLSITGDKHQSKLLGTRKYNFLGASPDGKWLAYMPRLTPDEVFQKPLSHVTLFLLSNTGQTIEKEVDLTKINDSVYPLFFFYFSPGSRHWDWVNNSLIYLRANYFEGRQHQGLPFMQYGYLNPIANEWMDDPIKALPGYQTFDRTALSPDNTRILYNRWDNQVTLVLWDLEQGIPVWQEEGQLGLSAWDPTSEYLAGAGFIIRRDGKQLRPIKRLFSHDQLITFDYSFLKWSPDSRFLAITGQIIRADPLNPESVLLIYDPDSETFIYRCPTWDSPAVGGAPDILWSPDGENILLSTPIPEVKPPLIYYDLKGGSTHLLAENGIALGWFRQSFLP